MARLPHVSATHISGKQVKAFSDSPRVTQASVATQDPDASKYPHGQATWDWATKARTLYHSQSKIQTDCEFGIFFFIFRMVIVIGFLSFL